MERAQEGWSKGGRVRERTRAGERGGVNEGGRENGRIYRGSK